MSDERRPQAAEEKRYERRDRTSHQYGRLPQSDAVEPRHAVRRKQHQFAHRDERDDDRAKNSDDRNGRAFQQRLPHEITV